MSEISCEISVQSERMSTDLIAMSLTTDPVEVCFCRYVLNHPISSLESAYYHNDIDVLRHIFIIFQFPGFRRSSHRKWHLWWIEGSSQQILWCPDNEIENQFPSRWRYGKNAGKGSPLYYFEFIHPTAWCLKYLSTKQKTETRHHCHGNS